MLVLIDADTPGKEDLHLPRAAEFEEARVFQKEGPLFREEKIEAGEVDLLFVDFNLGEVGIDGAVQGEAGSEAVLEVQSDVALEFRRISRMDVVLAVSAQHVGQELETAVVPDLQSVQRPGQVDVDEAESP